MPETNRRYTADEVLAFPDDGNRYELVDGELLVTAAPDAAHQAVLGRLYFQLAEYLKAQKDLMVLFSPAEITWGREHVVHPDLFVVPAKEISQSWETVRALLLAVEVVSPSSAEADRVTKRKLYQARGVESYWVVDPAAARIEVWRPKDDQPAIVTEVIRWRVTPQADEFVLDLKTLFAEVPGS